MPIRIKADVEAEHHNKTYLFAGRIVEIREYNMVIVYCQGSKTEIDAILHLNRCMIRAHQS